MTNTKLVRVGKGWRDRRYPLHSEAGKDNFMNRFLQTGLILVLVMVLAGTAGAAGPTKEECALAGIKNPKQLTTFVKNLQIAIKNGDKAAVANMVNYPIEVELNGASVTIEEKAAFIQNYDAILTKEVQTSMLEKTVDDIFVNRRGAYLDFVELTVEGGVLGIKAVH